MPPPELSRRQSRWELQSLQAASGHYFIIWNIPGPGSDRGSSQWRIDEIVAGSAPPLSTAGAPATTGTVAMFTTGRQFTESNNAPAGFNTPLGILSDTTRGDFDLIGVSQGVNLSELDFHPHLIGPQEFLGILIELTATAANLPDTGLAGYTLSYTLISTR